MARATPVICPQTQIVQPDQGHTNIIPHFQPNVKWPLRPNILKVEATLAIRPQAPIIQWIKDTQT